MIDFFNDFNAEQLKAITSDANKICVFAGPGTGKTKALVGRYVYLQKELNISPANVLCLTFTKKAAEEMENRIGKICGDNKSKYICTIHSLANKILSTEIFHMGFPGHYSLLTDEDQRTLLYDLMQSMDIYPEYTFKDAIEHISKCKSQGNMYVDLILNPNLVEQELIKAKESSATKLDLLFLNYLYSQSKNYYLDFHDLIVFGIELFNRNENILKKWSSRFLYILVDEFQDLTKKEFQFISLLASYNKRIFGVGDPDQSIYRFRGSDVTIFNDFYNNADATFDFGINYRSYQEIIDLSHDLISVNIDRVNDVRLVCDRGHNLKTKIISTKDKYSEALYVFNRIDSLVKKGAKLDEFAVLYRNNVSSLQFEECFQMKKMPYKVYSTNDFFNSDEIKTAISYFKFLLYHDDVSFLNIYRKPVRYISKVMINKIKELAIKNRVSYWKVISDNYADPLFNGKFDSFVEFVNEFDEINPNEDFEEWCSQVLKKSGFFDYLFSLGDEDKANRIKQLFDMIHVFEPTDLGKNIAEEFLDFIALTGDGDSKEEVEKVQLMSIHCSKGLQFKYVFLADFNEGYIPSSKCADAKDYAEERRITYVALTRAQDELCVIYTTSDSNVSEFFKHFSEKNYVLENYVSKETKERTIIYCGAHVRSKKFGNGIVLSIDSSNGTCIVKFNDNSFEREVELKTLMINNRYRELNFAIDERIVEKIKNKYEQKYQLGDIIIHKLYGSGIITKLIDADAAYIKFNTYDGMFDLKTNLLIKRDEYIRHSEEKDLA